MKAPRNTATAFGCAALAGLLFALAGCAGSGRSAAAPASPAVGIAKRKGVPAAHAKIHAPRSAQNKKGAPRAALAGKEAAQKHPLDLVGKVNGRGWYLPWYKRDPKRMDGPLIPVLLAEAETGEITRHTDNPEIVMHHVQAKLFQKGIHAANIRAGTVRADQQAEKVFATGGCRVVSLVNPADTVLTADKITWESANSRFVAEGHARVARRPRNGGAAITQEGGKIVYDLEHNTVTIL